MSIYTLGIDIGSTASKCVMLQDGKEIVSKSLVAVGAGTMMDPFTAPNIVKDLEQWLWQHGYKSVREIIGLALK